jgi:hypothetical protein
MASRSQGRAYSERTKRRQSAVDRRREDARRQMAAMRRAERRRRRRQFVAVGVIVGFLAAAGGTFIALDNRSGSASPSTTTAVKIPPAFTATKVSSDSGDRTITAPTNPFAIVYAITQPAVDGYSPDTFYTEELTVQRPFDGRQLLKSGLPPGDALQQDLISSLSKISSATSTGAPPSVEPQEPTVAIGDVRIDTSLGDLVDAGYFVPRERRTLLGRECVVYRTGTLLESRSVAKPTADEYTDVCIDAAGFELEEVAVASGSMTLHVVARSVDATSPVAANAFTMDPAAVSASTSTVTVSEIDKSVAPTAAYWRATSVPSGYTLTARYKLVDTSGGTSATTSTTTTVAGPAAAPTPAVRYIDLYVKGTNFISIVQGEKASETATDTTTAEAVDQAGAMADAHLALGLVGNTFTAHPTDATFVHITATLSKSALLDVAKGLTSA